MKRRYGSYIIQSHGNAAGGMLYGVRRPEDRKFCAGPFRTPEAAQEWIDKAEAPERLIERENMSGPPGGIGDT